MSIWIVCQTHPCWFEFAIQSTCQTLTVSQLILVQLLLGPILNLKGLLLTGLLCCDTPAAGITRMSSKSSRRKMSRIRPKRVIWLHEDVIFTAKERLGCRLYSLHLRVIVRLYLMLIILVGRTRLVSLTVEVVKIWRLSPLIIAFETLSICFWGLYCAAIISGRMRLNGAQITHFASKVLRVIELLLCCLAI